MTTRRIIPAACGAALAAALLLPAPAGAQLDPLLFLKTSPQTQPNVILAVDTANRMQMDAEGTYYDPGLYALTGAAFESALGLMSGEAATSYRRRYRNLQHENVGSSDKFSASVIEAVGDREAGYVTFYERTRLAIARRGLSEAITHNQSSARFALVKTRQSPLLRSVPSAGNESPVRVSDAGQQLVSELSGGRWKITRTLTSSDIYNHQGVNGLLTAADTANANTTILSTLAKTVGEAGALVPTGRDTKIDIDAPLGLLLDDARAHASSLIAADAAVGGCRNTIVVLVAGGGEGTLTNADLATKASTFLDVSGRRVPIYVIALFPATDTERSALQAVAANSGGQYFEITKAMVDATTPGRPVPEVVRAVNTAVQHAYIPATTFNTRPTADLPFGPYGEYQTTSPIIGSVNLYRASKLTPTGPQQLPDSETLLVSGTTTIPQRSNVMVTSGFRLPGFDAKIRGYRVYKPVPDATKASGYKFVQDGSLLWENRTPAAGSRNIFTVLPGSSTLVPFTETNASLLQPYLNAASTADAAALIRFVRALPMGAVIGSTPAFLDAPSLDPPPDAFYPGFREANKRRRSLVFVGANDGMLHALDGRSGLEVWAFIPFNLLPKLKALPLGQSLDAFKYYVDSSPKIADVRVDGEWKTYLFFGQGPGGTFYNTLDVTLEKIDEVVAQDSNDENLLLTYFANPSVITWKWSFPRNTSFDDNRGPYGELSATNASAVELTIGETWSDPAIGQVQNESGPYVMAVGSGFLKSSIEKTFRSGVARAGTTFYVLDVATGRVLGTPRDVGADLYGETLDDCRAINDCRRQKNALQMDPVATGPMDQRFITMVYIGDLDGNVWKFNLAWNGVDVVVSTPTRLFSAGPDKPLFSSMATVNVGGANQYVFVGTGSDLLPSPDAANKKVTHSLLVLLDQGASATKTAEILLEPVDGAAGEERVTAFPAVAGDIVFFSTTTQSVATPCTPFTANLYAFTFIGGPAYDTNNDGVLSSGTTGSTGPGKKGGGAAPADSQKVFSIAGARATAPFVVDQHLVFSTGGRIQMFGDPEDFNNGVGQAGVRILSWRSIR